MEYLAQRCDYATGWSASAAAAAVIKEDVVGNEENRSVFFGTGQIDRTKLQRRYSFEDEVMKY